MQICAYINNQKSLDLPVLVKLYKNGKLANFPYSENRLTARLMCVKDYHFSLFSQKTTLNYDRLFVSGKTGKYEGRDLRCDAADRYLRALKFMGNYGVYALHFFFFFQNDRSFLLRHPVLNKGSQRTYKMVYQALNAMLDKLIAFYDQEAKK